MNYYQKYINFDKQKVWYEILALDHLEQDKNSDDILLILEYFTKTVVTNLSIIYEFLKDTNYIFTSVYDREGNVVKGGLNEYTSAYMEAETNNLEQIYQIRNLVNSYGIIPSLFTKLYEKISFVSFEGYFPEWEETDYFDGFLPVTDPIVLLSIELMMIFWDINDYPKQQHCLLFSPDSLAKSNYSGSGILYGISLYEKKMLDGIIVNYRQNDLLFSDYLRNCFKWGGFPGLEFINYLPKSDKNLNLIKKIAKEMYPL